MESVIHLLAANPSCPISRVLVSSLTPEEVANDVQHNVRERKRLRKRQDSTPKKRFRSRRSEYENFDSKSRGTLGGLRPLTMVTGEGGVASDMQNEERERDYWEMIEKSRRRFSWEWDGSSNGSGSQKSTFIEEKAHETSQSESISPIPESPQSVYEEDKFPQVINTQPSSQTLIGSPDPTLSIPSMISSVEELVEQYRNLVATVPSTRHPTPNPETAPDSSPQPSQPQPQPQPQHQPNLVLALAPLQFYIPPRKRSIPILRACTSFTPPSPDTRTLRKKKRQHSLRKQLSSFNPRDSISDCSTLVQSTASTPLTSPTAWDKSYESCWPDAGTRTPTLSYRPDTDPGKPHQPDQVNQYEEAQHWEEYDEETGVASRSHFVVDRTVVEETKWVEITDADMLKGYLQVLVEERNRSLLQLRQRQRSAETRKSPEMVEVGTGLVRSLSWETGDDASVL